VNTVKLNIIVKTVEVVKYVNMENKKDIAKKDAKEIKYVNII